MPETDEAKRHVFKIPKSFVQGFNGSEVLLSVPSSEVWRFELI
jgi:hypothetical protein